MIGKTNTIGIFKNARGKKPNPKGFGASTKSPYSVTKPVDEWTEEFGDQVFSATTSGLLIPKDFTGSILLGKMKCSGYVEQDIDFIEFYLGLVWDVQINESFRKTFDNGGAGWINESFSISYDWNKIINTKPSGDRLLGLQCSIKNNFNGYSYFYSGSIEGKYL